MKNKLLIAAAALFILNASDIFACTNIIVTKEASADGSTMVSYAADSHWLYGELYLKPAGTFKPGAMRQVIEWDTYRPLGKIPEVAQTYQRMGNMNEHQLIIGETTWGGREEQINKDGLMDYGSLMYIALERAKSAREAIKIIADLANTYGYCSEGETFSIADKDEAWIMDLVGKGSEKGIVWVARRVPDGYICAHANQARITRFPLHDSGNCQYSEDVISFARANGWFNGTDEEFSFRDAYNPLDFGGARGCESRVWSAFNILCDGHFTFMDAYGSERGASADDYLSYAMGHDLKGEMPLFVKPLRKITVKDVADAMRDHFEGTPMDMRVDAGAGGNACPYRWRPMSFKVDGDEYVNERAIATQQTGFWFVAQARPSLPDAVGALIWFGVDDTATSWLTPIYVSSTEVPECFKVGNGDLLHYSAKSAFWINNRVSNSCYRMYNQMEPFVRERVDAFENEQMNKAVPEMDKKLADMVISGKADKAVKQMTTFTVNTAQKQFKSWVKLEETLLVKFIDGNVKAQDAKGNFKHTKYHEGTPEDLTQPGYTERFKRAIVRDNGEVLRAR
ncbi:MAG: C69 family dipeptidase [Bacteroidales bacterium]|nr:C69 family dipeptidase [Bacteroidales bacterium]